METIAVSARRAAELLDVSTLTITEVPADLTARVPHLSMSDGGSTWECLKVMSNDAYVWLITRTDDRHDVQIDDASDLRPPLPQPPEWLADRWVNVWPDVVTNTVHQTGQLADLYASPGRIGRVSLTGQWVPCDGKQVLA